MSGWWCVVVEQPGEPADVYGPYRSEHVAVRVLDQLDPEAWAQVRPMRPSP